VRTLQDIVPKSGDFSAPIVCRVAGFNPNQRWRQSGKKRQHLRASELSFENGLSRIVDAMNLKDVLGQIQSELPCFEIGSRFSTRAIFRNRVWSLIQINGIIAGRLQKTPAKVRADKAKAQFAIDRSAAAASPMAT
jgi:hypothetical protein